MARFKEFCSLPASNIAELPLSKFDSIEKWFTDVCSWLFNNPFTHWMSEIKEKHPKMFWISSVVWIPLAIVFYFLALYVWLICAYYTIMLILGSAIFLAAFCKVCHIILFLIPKLK